MNQFILRQHRLKNYFEIYFDDNELGKTNPMFLHAHVCHLLVYDDNGSNRALQIPLIFGRTIEEKRTEDPKNLHP